MTDLQKKRKEHEQKQQEWVLERTNVQILVKKKKDKGAA